MDAKLFNEQTATLALRQPFELIKRDRAIAEKILAFQAYPDLPQGLVDEITSLGSELLKASAEMENILFPQGLTVYKARLDELIQLLGIETMSQEKAETKPATEPPKMGNDDCDGLQPKS